MSVSLPVGAAQGLALWPSGARAPRRRSIEVRVPAWIVSEDGGGVTIAVQVVPRASRSEVAGAQGDLLKVRITAPPVEGAANEALLAFLAGALGVRKRDVELAAGAHARRKLVRIRGLDAQTVEARLLPGRSPEVQ